MAHSDAKRCIYGGVNMQNQPLAAYVLAITLTQTLTSKTITSPATPRHQYEHEEGYFST